MKKFILYICLVAVVLVLQGCPYINNPEEPLEEKVNFKESWKVMAAFLSDNYTKGDSLIFYNEPLDVLDTFVVAYCDALGLILPNDTNYTDDEELGYIVYDTISVGSGVSITNGINMLDISLSMSETAGAFLEIFEENQRYTENLWTDLDLSLLMNGVTDYTITNSIGQSCYLRKNEGIISFSDEKGNTWTKK